MEAWILDITLPLEVRHENLERIKQTFAMMDTQKQEGVGG